MKLLNIEEINKAMDILKAPALYKNTLKDYKVYQIDEGELNNLHDYSEFTTKEDNRVLLDISRIHQVAIKTDEITIGLVSKLDGNITLEDYCSYVKTGNYFIQVTETEYKHKLTTKIINIYYLLYLGS